MDTSHNSIQGSWKGVLKELILSESLQRLNEFVANEQKTHLVCPPKDQLFAAFNHTAFENVKVVIIGQDPYHKKGQANGLAFSVSQGVAIPPSLKNIFKELKSDLNIPIPKNGNLEPWADQGVLLLNATLTVREGVAGSHQKKGWEFFTDEVIKILSEQKSGIVFLLWGNFAQSKEKIINQDKHVILKAAHPSPLARGAFFGCKHFSKTNEILIKQGLKPIDWSLEKEEPTLF